MTEPVVPGEILAEKYRVDRVLGVGGMGVVVAATHLQLDQQVALKFMLASGFDNPEALVRFEREARIVVKLRSEHVARVLDTGTLANGAPYIVMEYLEGTDLAATLKQHGPMPIGLAADCIVQACDALGEAHALGIVHRDIKPANLFRTQRADGSALIKVLDFGISKTSLENTAGLAMTKTTAVMGSPLFMSPEQMRSSRNVDPRSDVWALGAVLYKLLTGRTPFVGETYAELVYTVMSQAHAPAITLRPDTPAAMSVLIDRCLSKVLDARVQSVGEMAAALAPFCSPEGAVIAHRVAAVSRQSPGIHGASDRASGVGAPPPRMDGPERTAPGWGATGGLPPPRPASPRWIPVAAVAIVGVLITSVSLLALHRSEFSSTSAAGPGAPPAAVLPPTPPSPPTTASAAAVATDVPAQVPVAAVASVATPGSIRPSAVARPSGKVAGGTRRSAATAAPVSNPLAPTPGIMETSN